MLGRCNDENYLGDGHQIYEVRCGYILLEDILGRERGRERADGREGEKEIVCVEFVASNL